MKAITLLFLAISAYCFGSPNGNQDAPAKRKFCTERSRQKPFFAEIMKVTCRAADTVKITPFQYYFFQDTGDLSSTEAAGIMHTFFEDQYTCGAFETAKKYQLNPKDTIVIEQHTAGFARIVKPFSKTSDTDSVESAIRKAFPFAVDYWHSLGLNFSQDTLVYAYEGSNASWDADTLRAFKVIMNGGQGCDYDGELRWFIRNQYLGTYSMHTESKYFGETGETVQFFKKSDTSWSITGVTRHDIAVDAANKKKGQIFESVFFELLHRLVAEYRLKKTLECLNSPPYHANTEEVSRDYIRYDELAVHYVGICLLQEMMEKGYFSQNDLTDPLEQYKDVEGYRGLITLLKKFPPSLENGRNIMAFFLLNPKNMATLSKPDFLQY